MKILNFNDNWGFCLGDIKGAEAVGFNDGSFAPVSVPHTMRLEKVPAGGAKDVYQGIGWYRRYFTLDSSFKGKQLKIDFEGVQIDCDVFLNGEKLLTHNGGYMGFTVDITDKVKFNENNVLAVRVSSVDNLDTPPGKPLANVDFHYYGGIYRNVYLRVTDNLFITDPLEADEIAGGGVFVTYPEVSREKAVVSVKTHVANKNNHDVNGVLKSSLIFDGEVIATAETSVSLTADNSAHFEQSFTVNNPKLWCHDEPNLYTLKSEIIENGEAVDVKETTIGIRRIEMRPDGFYLNGEKLYLRGANRHQCYAYIGDGAPDSMQRRDARQLKENGFNSVRAAHYPQSPAFMDECDKLGLLVIVCQPGWQQFTETETFYNYTIRDCREMIRRDRNHPCVFLWETSLNETHYSAEWAKEITEVAHAEYPGDQFFTASDYGLQGEFFDVNYKIIDGEDYDPNKTAFTREWGDRGGHHQFRRKDGERLMRLQVETHERYLNDGGYPDWSGLDSCERMAGYFMWSWNDYARGYNVNMLPSGCVEIDRSEKYLAYYLQSMLPGEKKPMIFIANRYKISSGRMIRVYSNCDTVKLYQNKKLIGELHRDDTPSNKKLRSIMVPFSFSTSLSDLLAGNHVDNVPNIIKKGGSPIYNFRLPFFKGGKLTAKAYINGKEVASHTVRAPGFASKIEIVPFLRDIVPVADGSDLIPVHFKVTDKNGALITGYRKKIHISVSGEGELVGEGVDRIGVEYQKPNAGVAFAFIKTTKNAGEIKISAELGKIKSTAVIKTAEYNGTFVPDGEHTSFAGSLADFENVPSIRTNIIEEKFEKISPKNIKSITATCENEEGRGTDKLIDGDTLIGTGWLAKTNELPQSITFEFKKPQSMSACAINWEKDSSWYKFNFELSENGEDWQTVWNEKSVGGQERNIQKFPKEYKNIKFARITVLEVVSSSGTPRTGIAEVEFYK